MKNEFFKYAGFNGAVLALLMVLISPLQLHAQPQGPPTKEKVTQCRAVDSVDPAALVPMQEFWQQAWGRALAFGEEGMALQKTGSPGQWDVLVSNKTAERYVDRGTFVEEARFAVDLGAEVLDRVYLETANATYLQRYVMAGIVIGSTGYSIAVTAMVSDLGDNNGSIARSFSILQVGTDSAESRAFAETTAGRLSGTTDESITVGDSGFEKSASSSCADTCQAQHNGRVALCNAAKDSCIAIAIAAAAVCVVACAAASGGLGLPICLGICDLALAGGLGLCATTAASCLNDSWTQFHVCMAPCTCFFCGQSDPEN